MSGWDALKAAAGEPSQQLRTALSDPGASQLAFLRAILKRNRDTDFGRRYGFDSITGIDAFRDAVPVATHADFADDIAAIADGAENRLTADPVVAFERTGGTSSGGKLVPYTARALAGFRAAVLPWLGDLVARHPRVADGSAYVSISPATRQPEHTSGGIPVGLMSDAAYLGEDLIMPFANLLAVSPDTGAIGDINDWRLSTLAQLVERDDLAFVSVWSPTFFLNLIEALPAHAPEIMPCLSTPAAQRLQTALAGGGIDTQVLWPRLAVLSCWTDASSKPFSDRLASLCPQAALQPKGLLATEAALTLPFGAGPGCVPALTSAVIEFRDESGGFHLADDLERGASYDVILTTEGGLYRYDIGDRLRCVEKTDGIERLVFEGRAGVVSDMVGEKLDEAFVAGVLGEVSLRGQLFARPGRAPHYEFRSDAPIADQLAQQLETALSRNPQYAYARRIGQLGDLKVIVDISGSATEAETRARQGQRLGDVKPAALIPAKAT